jgi:hypothetical protein
VVLVTGVSAVVVAELVATTTAGSSGGGTVVVSFEDWLKNSTTPPINTSTMVHSTIKVFVCIPSIVRRSSGYGKLVASAARCVYATASQFPCQIVNRCRVMSETLLLCILQLHETLLMER